MRFLAVAPRAGSPTVRRSLVDPPSVDYGRAAVSSTPAVCLRGYPTQNLLARPPIESIQFAQSRPLAVVMMIQNFTTNTGNVQKRQFPSQERADGGFIGPVQNRPARA